MVSHHSTIAAVTAMGDTIETGSEIMVVGDSIMETMEEDRIMSGEAMTGMLLKVLMVEIHI